MPNWAQDKAQSQDQLQPVPDALVWRFPQSRGTCSHYKRRIAERKKIYKSHSFRGFILKVICFLQDWIWCQNSSMTWFLHSTISTHHCVDIIIAEYLHSFNWRKKNLWPSYFYLYLVEIIVWTGSWWKIAAGAALPFNSRLPLMSSTNAVPTTVLAPKFINPWSVNTICSTILMCPILLASEEWYKQ